MSKLITIPNFTFTQGDPFDLEEGTEYPIEVQYYRDSICLVQNGNEILISGSHYKKLFKEAAKHYEEAQAFIKK